MTTKSWDELKIPAETASKILAGLTLAEVETTYLGRDGCACGCLGTYIYTSQAAHEDWQGKSNNSAVLRRLDRMKNLVASGVVRAWNYDRPMDKTVALLTINYGEHGKRVMTVYSNKQFEGVATN